MVEKRVDILHKSPSTSENPMTTLRF